ncbi:MAG: tetratricopeptide repeat protein [Spirochaetales bacterium]|nr:tetratricopeptide repeat protein [Spirochaetales bacterium]
MEYSGYIVAGIVVFIVLLLFTIFFPKNIVEEKKKKTKYKAKDRNKILAMANRKLAQNPRDPEAIAALAELFFKEGNYEKAIKHYSILIDLVAAYPELNEFEVNLNYGLCALKLKQYEEAYKSLFIARNINAEDFQVNYNLGMLEFNKKNYDKAALLLSQANTIQPDHIQTTRLLGHSLLKIKKCKDAIASLEKAVEYEPDDKESLFALAQAYYEVGSNEKAILIFSHLRTDPKIGASAALISGTINFNTRQYNKAIMDYEIGLRHVNIPADVLTELKYRLGSAYLKTQNIDRALTLFREIAVDRPNYKDVNDQIQKYQELSSNKNLQVYLIAPTSEFITLCRKLVSGFFPKSRTKIIDITIIKDEFTDILTEINTKKWEDIILFRFIRSTGVIGELVTRELYARCKELRAGRGFCITAGEFTEGAQSFVEARLIDLIDKPKLVKLFDQVNRNYKY